MLSKIFVSLLAASSAIVSVTANAKYYGDKGYYKDDYYRTPEALEKEFEKEVIIEKSLPYERVGKYHGDDGYFKDDYYKYGGYYKDDYYRTPKVFDKEIIEKEVIIEEFLPRERVEHYGAHVDVLEKEDAFKSMKYPEVIYPKIAQREEFSEGHLDVKYLEKYPPKPQGAIIFPSEYAKYETKSEGPHVPLFKPRKIYADVFEKQFVCPKFEKVVYVTIPGKCTCEPINVHPKIIKAPKLIHGDYHGHDDHFGYDDEVIIKDFKEVKIVKEDDRKW
jgi:hypothetical protein